MDKIIKDQIQILSQILRRSTQSVTETEDDLQNIEDNFSTEQNIATVSQITSIPEAVGLESYRLSEVTETDLMSEMSESHVISEESDIESQCEKHIDIDALMANESLPTEEEFIEVIDVFRLNRLDGDPTVEEKQNVYTKLLLSENLELLPDMSPLNLFTEKVMNLLLRRFQLSKLMDLSIVLPELKPKVCERIANQTFLWLSTNQKEGRFPPHEDCCELCDHIIDTESCIQIKDSVPLTQILKRLIELSPEFSSLKCLRLFRFIIDEESDKLLAKMFRNLSHMDLTECKIKSWKHLSEDYENLEHLILPSTAINDQILKNIFQNKRFLKTFVANSTNITGEQLSQFPITTERLDIRCCPKLVPNYLNDILIKRLNRLKYLRIEVVFDDKTFALMCSTFENLILLELSAYNRKNTQLFTSDGLKQISKLSKLRSLKLGPNIAVHSIPLMEIFVGCPLMTSFSIDGNNCCVNIKENVLPQIADYWPLLRKLELKAVACVEEETIEGLSRLKFLSYLDLTECRRFDDLCLILSIRKMSKLSYLVLDKCNQLTILTYEAVIEKALTMDSVLSVSFFRCNFFIYYIKAEELPKNLRLTFASNKSLRFMTFDGNRVKIMRYEHFRKHLNRK